MKTRFRLLLDGAVLALLILVTIAQAFNAYNVTFQLFEDLATVDSIKVDAAESALQAIAGVSQATADYTALSSDTPLFEQAVNDIFRNFEAYRDDMFILRRNLQTNDESTAFTVADTYTYSRFWRHVSNLIDGRSDSDIARREYLAADDNLRNRIIPALQQLEAINFDLMVDAGTRARTDIYGQVLLLAIPAGLLAVALVYTSFWLRRKVRRYLTPGLDIAMFASIVLLAVMLLNLLSLPDALTRMTLDSYYSISGASRVLVYASLANRAESSAVIDVARKDEWYARFDANIANVEQLICRESGCLQMSFVTSGDNPAGRVVMGAGYGNDRTAAFNVALMGNITFAGEASALETARLALLEYLGIHQSLRALIDADDIAGAVELNTGVDVGDSEEAYRRFVAAMLNVQTINRSVFDDIWQQQQTELPRNQVLFGILGYALILVMMNLGLYQRYQEF
jgi:hypothetical protein